MIFPAIPKPRCPAPDQQSPNPVGGSTGEEETSEEPARKVLLAIYRETLVYSGSSFF